MQLFKFRFAARKRRRKARKTRRAFKSSFTARPSVYSKKDIEAAYVKFFSSEYGRIVLSDLWKECGYNNNALPFADDAAVYIQGKRDLMAYIFNRAKESTNEMINVARSKEYDDIQQFDKSKTE